MLGDLLRDLKQFTARVQFEEHCPTVVAAEAVTPFGLPTFFRFARFRVMGISVALIVLELGRETAQTEKGWPSFRSSLSRPRSCDYPRQLTKYACSLDQSPKAKRRRRATLG